jgi:hypothetical protein
MPPATGSSSEPLVLATRYEFDDCRVRNVILRGDPYLLLSMELPPSVLGGSGSPCLDQVRTHTMRVTGAVRVAMDSHEYRIQYDCTRVTTMDGANTPPQFTHATSGVMTWESPPGSVAMTRSCDLY